MHIGSVQDVQSTCGGWEQDCHHDPTVLLTFMISPWGNMSPHIWIRKAEENKYDCQANLSPPGTSSVGKLNFG